MNLYQARTAMGQIRQWKTAGDYPYADKPPTEADRLDRVERETFGYMATSVARKFPKSQIGRRTTLGSAPSSVPQILDQIDAVVRRPLPRHPRPSGCRYPACQD